MSKVQKFTYSRRPIDPPNKHSLAAIVYILSPSTAELFNASELCVSVFKANTHAQRTQLLLVRRRKRSYATNATLYTIERHLYAAAPAVHINNDVFFLQASYLSLERFCFCQVYIFALKAMDYVEKPTTTESSGVWPETCFNCKIYIWFPLSVWVYYNYICLYVCIYRQNNKEITD